MIIKDMKDTILFDVGEPNPYSQFFVGQSYLKMLTPGPNAIGNVTFEPGCRNNWHSLSGGQLLLITAGEGYYQAAGDPCKPENEWFEPVSDEQYSEANKVK